MNTTTCPHCAFSQAFPDHYAGRQIKCRQCGGEFVAQPTSASAHIPQPSTVVKPPAPKENANSTVSAIGGLIVAGAAAWYFLGGGVEKQAARDMDQIEVQVAEDAVRQYEIAKRNGTAIDASVAAGFVAAAYLQAEDEANYQRWKKIEEEENKRAGLTE